MTNDPVPSAGPPNDLPSDEALHDDQTTGAAPLAAAIAPMADRRPFRRELNGEVRVDHYQWLEERESDEVLGHLRAENAHTEQVMAPLDGLRQRLFNEIKARIKETDLSVPVIKDQWAYYSRTIEGQSYPLHCRRPVPPDLGTDIDAMARWLTDESAVDDEQVLLDENAEAEGREFFEIGLFEVSPDHRRLLWAFDDKGHERFAAYLRDLETAEDHDLGLTEIGYGSAWAMDNRTFFYVRNDDANRPYQVWRHRIGEPASAEPAPSDVLVFEEPDERFFVGVGREKDDSFLHIGASSKVTDEIWVIPADDPEAEPRVLSPRRQGVEYSACHHGSQFVILTNDGAENFRVMIAPDWSTDQGQWEELIPGHDTVTIMDVDSTDSYLTLFERADGITRIRLR
ncbi:MAG: oligopeptidase B, partial [Acidimicrobiia bacterium]|nr:oligopeptidase B [Acidimicrobiia bacterium]